MWHYIFCTWSHDLTFLLKEMDSEEDSGSNTSRGVTYETPPSATPRSSPTHTVMVTFNGREAGDNEKTTDSVKLDRIQKGKHLGEYN